MFISYQMIYASFREPVGIFANWFNHIAAKFTGGDYCHSEFIFEWTQQELTEVLQSAEIHGSSLNRIKSPDKIFIAVYVMWGMEVGYRVLTRDAQDPFWQMPKDHLVPVQCDAKQEKQLFAWCMDQMGKKYDKFGAMGCVVPVRSCQLEYDTYFCSQLMVCALNHIHVMSTNPGAASPNSLYSALTST